MFSIRRLVIEEATNVLAARLASGSLFLAALAAGFLVPAVNFSESLQIVETNSKFVEAGVNVVVASRGDKNPLDGRRCEELNRLEGIASAGGVGVADTVYLSTRPGQAVTLIPGTTHAAELIWPNDSPDTLRAASIVVGASIGRDYGLVPGSLIKLATSAGGGESTTAIVDYVASPTTRTAEADTTILYRAAITSVASCYVEYTSAGRGTLGSVVSGWWDPVTNVILSPLFVDRSGAFEPLSSALQSRMSQWVGLAAAALSGALFVAYVRSRRWEFATYVRLGLTAGGATIFAFVDSYLLLLLPMAVGFSLWLTVDASMTTVDVPSKTAVLSSLVAFASVPLFVPLVAVVIARGAPSSIFAER